MNTAGIFFSVYIKVTIWCFSPQIYKSTYHCLYQVHADLRSSPFIINRKKSVFSVLFISCYKICNNTYKLCFTIAPKIKEIYIFWIIHLIQKSAVHLPAAKKDSHNVVNFEFTFFDCIFQHWSYPVPKNNDRWRVEKSMPTHT